MKSIISTVLVLLGNMMTNKLSAATANSLVKGSLAMSPHEFNHFLVSKITKVSHDSKLFEISFPDRDQTIGGSATSNYVSIKGLTGRDKAYTPISLNDQKGHFDLLIRSYPHGGVSQYMDNVQVGDYIEVKGPKPKLQYTPNMVRRIGMLAGGTGIAPMIVFLKEIARNSEDLTEVSLIYSDRQTQDLLLKEQLDAFSTANPRIRVQYTLTRHAEEMAEATTGLDGTATVTAGTLSPVWNGLLGRINQQTISDFMPAPAQDTLILVCGCGDFVADIAGRKVRDKITGEKQQGLLGGYLKNLGYTESMVYKF